jgi:hypothetical protein
LGSGFFPSPPWKRKFVSVAAVSMRSMSGCTEALRFRVTDADVDLSVALEPKGVNRSPHLGPGPRMPPGDTGIGPREQEEETTEA